MVPVRIDCACGLHYSIDVEPVDGRMASAVSCPNCGADVTAKVNANLSHASTTTLKATVPVIIPPTKHELHLATPVQSAAVSTVRVDDEDEAPAVRVPTKGIAYSARQLGLVGREQALVEAHAKVSWGDTEEAVAGYLILQGYSVAEARELVAEMFRARRAATRANGIKKIVIGGSLMLVTVVSWAIFKGLDEITARITARIMGAAVLIGLAGLWFFVNGLVLLLAPKLDHQDLAEQ